MADESPRVDGRTARFAHRRPELLAAAADYVLDHGALDLSLRHVAQTLGVTHPTLLRHFKSKDELLLAVLEQIRADFEARLTTDVELAAAPSMRDLAIALWRRLCQPREQRQFRLLFDVAALPTLNDGRRFAPSVVDSWVDVVTDRLCAFGWNHQEATAVATAMLALFRGLQLDLMLTGDRARVDAALEASLPLFEPPAGEAERRRPPLERRRAATTPLA